MLAALALAAVPAAAQVPGEPSIGLLAAISSFEDPRTGSARGVSLRFDRRIGSPRVLGQLALAALLPDQRSSGGGRFLVPEAQLQLQRPVNEGISPYAGVGVGALLVQDRPWTSGNALVLSAAAGLRRVWGDSPWALHCEVRLRRVGGTTQQGRMLDGSFGASYRLR